MRKIIMVALAIGILVGSVFIWKYMIANKDNSKPEQVRPLQAVFVKPVQNTTKTIQVIESGSLVAKNKAELYSEVQGVMEAGGKEFKPGIRYNKGESLIRIRGHDFYANLQAQKSSLQNLITSALPDIRLDYPDAYPKWDSYVRSLDPSKPIPALPEVSTDKEKFFITGRNIYTVYYQTKNMEISLSKYTIRAPFDGVVSESLVTPGTVVRPGQKLGEYIDPSAFELKVAVSKSILPYLSVGKKVDVQDLSSNQKWNGTIIRINVKVDPTTQTVDVFIQLSGQNLKDGMFLEAVMMGKEENGVLEVNRNLLVDQNKLYVVKDSLLDIVPIEVVHFTETRAIVRGLTDGQLVVTRPVPNAYTGMKVSVSNEEAQ